MWRLTIIESNDMNTREFIEQLFFKHHYPCSSFVVISSKGDYISYFGEFPKEFVWEAVQILKQTISSYQSHNSP